ncbi:MAG: KpsF/GutQ family sugar-phosphate isomerase [candidate division Zixibacteria bacterium]|nr:KpsF/GutQ family sugar-phosphate isomerase [candidate division Zixibacteria bacterium]
MNLVKYAQDVIRLEAEAVNALADRLDENFQVAVDAILNCKGRVIVAGLGKSGLVGRKIVATFNSTGISSFFLHPAEALHGDLGLIRSEDILMILSKSGRQEELELIIGAARRLGVKIVVLGGNPESTLYNRADIALDCSVETEASPDNLVPTSSSTVTLVMGDALAVALLKARNFTKEDFAQLHPGGFLGQRLLKRVSEVHHINSEIPLVDADASFSRMMVEMSRKRLGCVITLTAEKKVAGIFCDGDLRRLMDKDGEFDLRSLTADDTMLKNPKTISQDAVLDAALAMMEQHGITVLPTVDDNDHLTGVIHLHDILKSKLV